MHLLPRHLINCSADHVGGDPEKPNPSGEPLRRSGRQRFDSAYIRMLWSGDGTHDGRTSDQVLPKGMRTVEDTVECASMAWELDDTAAVFALLAGSADAEDLEPVTIDEAKTRPDWPRWEEAINAELKSLDDAHT
ncbi:hypothetical protein HD554DRAFT_2177934 [Boletus coccyginus]|nr:hypothetical protein HD554DRAFT_2177934 [Boletus coccyginus]